MVFPPMPAAKAVVAVVVGIVATGALLKVAGEGRLGEAMQKIALAVTKGYGASA